MVHASNQVMVVVPSTMWNYLRSIFLDLISDRKIALRMRDISLIAVEGAVAGATIAMTMAILLFRRS